MNTAVILLISLVLQIAIGFGCAKYGYDKGYAVAKSESLAANIKVLSDTIESSEKLISAADDASLRLNKTISDRVTADNKTTQDIRNALATTAHIRVDCLFNNGIMQNLHTAAAAADQAAASGFNRALPASAAPNK